MNDERERGALVEAIYDAAVDPDKWPSTLAAIRQALGGEVSMLFCRDSTLSMKYCEASAMDGWSTQMVAPYHQHYGQIDTRTPVVAALPTGGVYVDDREMSFDAVQKSEIYQDWFRPLGLGYGMATPLFKTGGRHGLISVHRSVRCENFSAESIALFEFLAPHLVRALQIHRQMQRARELAGGLQLTLDHFPTAIFLVNDHGAVRHMNIKAAELVRLPNAPLSVIGGKIAAGTAKVSDELYRLITSTTSAGVGSASPSEIRVFNRPDGSGKVAVMVAPLRCESGLNIMSEPLAAIFVSDPSNSVVMDTASLVQQFGLTPAEAGLAKELCMGANLTKIADRKSVSIETVRTLAKRALAKTDSRSQGQLIAKVSRSLAALTTRRG